MKEKSYNREKAIQYAEKWAYSRNPKFYNYDNIGGDCTNFISQCIYAGCKIMNNKDWYYKNASPSMKETVKNRGYEEEILESSSMALLSFNCQVPPFNDNRVRQAILYAIDVDRSISNYLNGYA